MDLEKTKQLVKDFFEKRPSKDVYEKCLFELITEKNNIMANKDYDTILIDKIDKIIESIQLYVSIASK
jgi:hypothetical protein